VLRHLVNAILRSKNHTKTLAFISKRKIHPKTKGKYERKTGSFRGGSRLE